MININLLLKQVIENLVKERINEIYKKTKENSDYLKWVEESNSLIAQTMEILGQEKNIFFRLEELTSCRVDELLDNAYLQGFKDGLDLLKSLLGVELLKPYLYEGKNKEIIK